MEALERYHHFYGDDLRVECPTGSGRMMNLKEVAGGNHVAAGADFPARRGRARRMAGRSRATRKIRTGGI